MRRILFLSLSALLPLAALAAEAPKIEPVIERSAPITYLRTAIGIAVMGPVLNNQPPTIEKVLTYDVDIRSAQSFRHQEGWYSLSTIAPAHGVMVLEDQPQPVLVKQMAQYTPLDVLLIAEDGTVLQLLPTLVLSELAEPIAINQPVLATLYLGGGTAQREGIKPGDHVEYQAFKKRPVILGAPQPEASAKPVTPPAVQPAVPSKGVSVKDLYEQK